MEDFVTYHQAVKLKELGFDWECGAYYYIDSKEFRGNIRPDNHNYRSEIVASAPTLSQAQKWLREVKRIMIAIIPKYEIQCDGTYQWEFWYKIYNSVGKSLDSEPCGTYEYALEMAIDQSLELLKE